jgi:Ca-activated chloride channel family protein
MTDRLMFGAGVGGSPPAPNGQRDEMNRTLNSSFSADAADSKESSASEALRDSEGLMSVASPESNLKEFSQGMERQKRRMQTLSEESEIGVQFSLAPHNAAFLATETRTREELIELRRKGLKLEGVTFGRTDERESGTEAYEPIVENAFLTPMEQPLSTFSIDVDTASYANMRRFIQQGQLPPANAVRIEELVNYFRYDYPEPADGSPFSVNIDVATCPWNPQNKLARVGLKAKTIAEDKRPATNLVFLIDVSGSMAAENKLPLVKQALNVLVSKMGEDDQIAIVTYAGEAGLKLNSTSGSQRAVIQQAIDSLQSGGSTNGAAGINIAYDTAIQSFIKGGANRVIICTDGDFNVGVSDDNTLVEMIQEKAASGVFLSVFGFGMGNLKDAKLEKLADKGNGNYGYIDGLGEARKVFGEQLSGTLVTVAKDVKLQLEFNNSTVGAYRLIGYENRVLAAKDFDDDTKDAGEIGAGHTVTALYEIVPKAAWLTQAGLDPEKFDIVEKPTANDETKEAADGRLFTVKLRHKLPDAETSEKSQNYAAMNSDAQLSDSNVDFRFAAAVASFGMQLRESKFRGNWTLQNVLSIADASLSTDRNGERTEFTDLVRGVMRIKGDSITDPRLTTHETVAPATPAAELPAELAAKDARIKATVDGKYRRLLKKIEVRSDVAKYGEFRDFGHWDGTDYSSHRDLPAGYWVWVYPNWYIWGDAAETQDVKQ